MDHIEHSDAMKTLIEDFTLVSDIYDGTGAPDPYPLLAELRRTTPVMEGDILARFDVPSQADYGASGRKVFTVFRYADVMKVLRDPTNWLSSLNGDGFGAAVDNLLVTAMDGDEHKKFRTLFSPPFAMSLIRSWDQSLVRPIVQSEYADKIRPWGKADLLREFGLPIPVRVVYAMFGFPDDVDAVAKFSSWALRILAGPQTTKEKSALTQPIAMEAAIQLYEHVLPIIAARRAENRESEDLIGFLLGVEKDGVKFSDHDIATFVRMLLLAATETTTRTMANLILLLFKHPEVMERLRADRSLIPKAFTESMRFEPVAGHLARLAAKDMEIDGVLIPKGCAVTTCIAAAHRDESVFENPDVFDIDRPAKPVMGFGFGPHMCLGQHIARVEVEAAIDALLDFPNLRLDPDYPEPVMRGMQLRGPTHLRAIWD